MLLSCNTLNDAPNVSVPEKTDDANLNAFNMVIGIHGLKTLAKLGSC